MLLVYRKNIKFVHKKQTVFDKLRSGWQNYNRMMEISKCLKKLFHIVW